MEGAKQRKPHATAFKQQQLKAWQPILTPTWVISSFFFVGIVFIPIGAVILSYSDKIDEVSVRYDKTCGSDSSCVVYLEFDSDMSCSDNEPCYVYYKLTNYYQNHRRYVKSRSDDQLRGEERMTKGDLEDCKPVLEFGDVATLDPEDSMLPPLDITVSPAVYNPCGLIAWSYFNDTYRFCPDANTAGDISSGFSCEANETPIDQTGIAWSSDVDEKFKELDVSVCDVYDEDDYGENNNHDCNEYLLEGGEEPRWCNKTDCEHFVTRRNDLVTDEHFIVWMRVAGLPTFKKLWGKIEEDIEEGIHAIIVENRYDVSDFDGSKTIVVSTTEWLGGKNYFLAYSYLVVGCVCVFLAVAFLVKHLYSPRKLGDSKHLVWNH